MAQELISLQLVVSKAGLGSDKNTHLSLHKIHV